MDAQTFYEAVRERAQGSPYAVTRTEPGFDVHLDVVDARWHGALREARLTKATTHHVRVDATAGTYSVLQQDDLLRWQAGLRSNTLVPVLRASRSRTYGRTREVSRRQVYAWNAAGDLRKQADFTYRSEEGRALVTKVGAELGLEERMSGVEKGALWVGGVTVALLLLGGLVALLVLLLG